MVGEEEGGQDTVGHRKDDADTDEDSDHGRRVDVGLHVVARM